MKFSSRKEAGQKLARQLARDGARPGIVLGLPRGGVIVAAEVARILQRPLDVLVVRKIGHPRHREFAVGALAEPDVVLLDSASVEQTRSARVELEEVIAEETGRLHACQERFHNGLGPDLAGKDILIIDDGIATGATVEAAVVSARRRQARRITVATPVASASAVERIQAVADNVIALVIDPDFVSVGQYYESFPQTADEEVEALLCARN